MELTQRVIVSEPHFSEVASAAQVYDHPVTGSSYSSISVVPNWHMKYLEMQGVVTETVCETAQVPAV